MASVLLLSDFPKLAVLFNIVLMYLGGVDGGFALQRFVIQRFILFLVDRGEFIWIMMGYAELLNVHLSFIYVKYIKSNNYFINCFLGSSFLST